MNRAQVVLTGFDGIDETGPGLSVARALKAAFGDEVTCTALVGDTVTPAAWMSTAVERVMLCEGWRHDRSKAVAMLRFEAACRPITALIPGSTSDTLAFSGLEGALTEAGIGLFVPEPKSLLRLIRREDFEALLADVNIGAPNAAMFTSEDDVLRASPLLAYPLVVSAGAQRRIVRSQSDLKVLIRSEPPNTNQPVMLSAVTEGDTYRFACLAEQGVLGPAVVSRVLGWTWQGGIAAASVVEDRDVAEAGRRVVEALAWTGPLEIELRRTGETGSNAKLVLTDVQCRLPSWSMLGHWSGTNLAAGFFRRVRDGAIPVLDRPRAGTMSVRSNRETSVSAHLVEMTEHSRSLPPSIVTRQHRLPTSKDPCVAVTGLSASDVINPGLGVARALTRAQMPMSLIGLSYAAFDAGAYETGLFDRVHLLEYPYSSAQQLDRMRQLTSEAPIDALLPCLDGEVELVIENAAAIEDMGIALLLPSREAFHRRSKEALFGPETPPDWDYFSIPRSLIVETELDLTDSIREFELPAVAKGPHFGCQEISSLAEASKVWRELTFQGEKKMILQERLTGPSYAVSVVCDRGHNVVSALTIKKTALCRRGSTWSGISQHEPELERAFGDFLKTIRWVGPAEGEFIRDAGGRFCLIEVNPRFTGWISCAPDMGVNQPEIAARLALGRPLDMQIEPRNIVFMRAPDEVRVPPTRLSTLATRRTIRHELPLAV